MKNEPIKTSESFRTGSLHAERMTRFSSAGLYLVTSQELSGGRSTKEIVRAALAGGVKLIQLREKSMPPEDLLTLAHAVRKMTWDADALLIINDCLDIALKVGADGVHLGQHDMPVAVARQQAPDMIIGASTHSIAEAAQARTNGASYINIGPLFATKTKLLSIPPLGVRGLASIAAAAKMPFTVMGGIKEEHILELIKLNARTIAVVTAITAATDPAQASRRLLNLISLCIKRLP